MMRFVALFLLICSTAPAAVVDSHGVSTNQAYGHYVPRARNYTSYWDWDGRAEVFHQPMGVEDYPSFVTSVGTQFTAWRETTSDVAIKAGSFLSSVVLFDTDAVETNDVLGSEDVVVIDLTATEPGHTYSDNPAVTRSRLSYTGSNPTGDTYDASGSLGFAGLFSVDVSDTYWAAATPPDVVAVAAEINDVDFFSAVAAAAAFSVNSVEAFLLSLTGKFALVTEGGVYMDASTGGFRLVGDELQDDEVADDITLTNITQITNRSHSDTQNLLVVNDHDQYYLETEIDDVVRFLDGSSEEGADMTVVNEGGNVIYQIQGSGANDIHFRFHGEQHTLDTTPSAEVILTAGTDPSPTLNYVFVIESGAVALLQTNTTGFPTTAHSPLATVLVQSAASVGNHGVYKLHAWTDHSFDDNGNGHLGHINEKLRSFAAEWDIGAAPLDLVGNVLAVESGTIFQLHPQSFPAISMADEPWYVTNDPTTANLPIQNVDDFSQDADGNTLNNKYFNVVVWGTASENESDCKVWINLPSGTYNNSGDAIDDASATAIYTIPRSKRGVGFLIARYTLRLQGGNVTQSGKETLLGITPSTSIGGAGGAAADHSLLSNLLLNNHPIYGLLAAIETVTAVWDFSAGLTATTASVDNFFGTEGFVVQGTLLGGAASPVVEGTGVRVVWWPKNAALRAGYVSGTDWDAGNVGLYSAAFGRDNVASGSNSFSMGQDNDATGNFSTIAGGKDSLNSGNHGTVSGGLDNDATYAGNGYQTIGGGQSHDVTGLHGTIAGGAANVVSASNGTVGGGTENEATADGTTVSGGVDNVAGGQYSAVIGGENAIIAAGAQYSSILGGVSNDIGANGDFGATIAGQLLESDGNFSIVGGHLAEVHADNVFAYIVDNAAPPVSITQSDSIVFYNDDNGGFSLGINETAPLAGTAGLEVDGFVRIDTGTNGSNVIATGVGDLYVEGAIEAGGVGAFNSVNATVSLSTPTLNVSTIQDSDSLVQINDSLEVTGSLSVVETKTINIHPWGMNIAPDQIADFEWGVGGGANADYLGLVNQVSPARAMIWLDLKPGTVISAVHSEWYRSPDNTTDPNALIALIREDDAESAGDNTRTTITTSTADVTSTTPQVIESTGLAHTVLDDNHYAILLNFNSNSVGDEHLLRLVGVWITISTEVF